jgi:hypothetical protein
MRRLAPPIICLAVLFAVAYGSHGETQSRRKPSKATPTARPTPEPDSLEGLPPLKPTPTPKPTDDFFADLPDAEPEPSSEWKLILFQNHLAYFYNTRRITQPKPGIVKVWIKWQPFRERRKAFINEAMETGRDYGGYGYSLHLEEYDCKGFRRLVLKAVDYTLSAEFISSTDMKGEWTDVVPESVGETILEAVCRHKQ